MSEAYPDVASTGGMDPRNTEPKDMTGIAFEAWWLRHGQFLRAGGGDYEKTFAYHAYLAALEIPVIGEESEIRDLFGLAEDESLKDFVVRLSDQGPTAEYLKGHADGLEWAARQAEANDPRTGDWLHDDPHELAKALRKGPELPAIPPGAEADGVADKGLLKRVVAANGAFEAWSVKKNQGYDLSREDRALMATYRDIKTEHAWRGYCHAVLATKEATNG